MLNFKITVKGREIPNDCRVVKMVQYGSKQIVTKGVVDEFASLARIYLNEDNIDLNDIAFSKNSFSYKDRLKMKFNEVHHNYDKMKEEKVAELRTVFDKKFIKPVNGIISHFKDEYGNGKKEMTVYKFDDFLNSVGPKTVSDIKSKLEEISYSGHVNIAVVGVKNQYNQIIITPTLSAPLGSHGGFFDSKALETLNPDEPNSGHDMGLTNAVELELYDIPPEKGF